jgi:2-oxoglutarate-dependent dioxygenase
VNPVRFSCGEVRFYREEGYLFIPGLIGESDAEALRAEVMDIMDKIGLPPTKLKQTTAYLAGGPIDALVNSPALLSVAAQLMEGPSSLYMPFTAVKTSAGGRFHFHQDNNYTRFDGPGINLWTALTPMTPQNGCLQVVPRSHRQGVLDSIEADDKDGHRKVTWEPDDFLPLRMRPGDCVAFSRCTVHGSGANETNEPRVAYAVQFHRDDVSWINKETGEKQLLKTHPRWPTAPVAQISVPKGKQDGH